MHKKFFIAAIAAALMVTGCEKENPEENPENTEGGKGKYLIGTTVKNSDGMSGSSYMQLVPDLSGSIDNFNAIPIEFSTSAGVIGNEIFVFPSMGIDSENKLKKYTYKAGEYLGEPQELDVPAYSFPFNITKVSDEKAYLPSSGIGKVLIINPKTMKLTGEIDLSSYAHSDNSPEPANGIIRDGLYYLCLDQAGPDYMPYSDYRQADVLIIDINTDEVLKMISETESQLSFPTRPMEAVEGMIFKNEQNDIYIACVGYFGYKPQYPQTGFVCIPSGQQEFDVSKSWDVSQDTILGTDDWKPTAVFNCKYIGNNKLAAYVGVMELMDANNPYTSKNNMAVIIDLEEKTIKKVEGIPYTDGHSVFITKYNNQVIFAAYGKDKAGFFSYNPTDESVEQLLSTEGNPAFLNVIE